MIWIAAAVVFTACATPAPTTSLIVRTTEQIEETQYIEVDSAKIVTFLDDYSDKYVVIEASLGQVKDTVRVRDQEWVRFDGWARGTKPFSIFIPALRRFVWVGEAAEVQRTGV